MVYKGPPDRFSGKELLPDTAGSLVEDRGDGSWRVSFQGMGRVPIHVDGVSFWESAVITCIWADFCGNLAKINELKCVQDEFED